MGSSREVEKRELEWKRCWRLTGGAEPLSNCNSLAATPQLPEVDAGAKEYSQLEYFLSGHTLRAEEDGPVCFAGVIVGVSFCTGLVQCLSADLGWRNAGWNASSVQNSSAPRCIIISFRKKITFYLMEA